MKKFLLSLLVLFASYSVAQNSSNICNGYEFVDIESGVYSATNSFVAGAEEICDVVEQMPTYPGGQKALLQYIADNIKYPRTAQEKGIQGRVVVRFVVKKDGTIGDVQIFRGVSDELNQEAIRVIKSITGFIPGYQNGKPVNVWHTLPVSFKLM
ncbi:MAG: energy transducer TonB [Bacteroidales bacterium]|nr:energy transducer TonB [Bacteroidales bacterium]